MRSLRSVGDAWPVDYYYDVLCVRVLWAGTNRVKIMPQLHCRCYVCGGANEVRKCNAGAGDVVAESAKRVLHDILLRIIARQTNCDDYSGCCALYWRPLCGDRSCVLSRIIHTYMILN